MTAHQGKVKRFFSKPENYLHKRFGIQLRLEIIDDYVSGTKCIKNELLDIGCGDGSLSLPYLNAVTSLTLVDVSAAMLELAKRRASGSFSEEGMAKIKFVNSDVLEMGSDQTFEIVFCIGVLAHVSNLDIFLAKIDKLTRFNSLVFVQLSTWYHPLTVLNLLLSRRGYRVNRLTKNQMVRKFSVHDFDMVFARRYLFPFPGMSLIGDTALFRFQNAVRKTRTLSWLCSDYILVFKKQR